MKKIAVFIDRDGTINEEVGYVDHLDKFRILPMVPEAIRKLNQNGIPSIMITNQSGVARGYFSLEFLDSLHKKMAKELEENGCALNGIYVCPHHPDDHCACRKPKPGMLLRAAREKGITLHRSYVIGDKMIDIKLAHHVGAKGILVLTGYGAEEVRSIKQDSDNKPDYIAPNLYEAVGWVLEDIKNKISDRILIVKPSSLGDIIHSLPVLWVLRRLKPEAHIGWVVKEEWQEILTGNPLIDEVIVLKKGLRGILSAVRDIRKMKYDVLLDLQGLFRSGIIGILSGARERIGFSKAREFSFIFYNKKVSIPGKFMHAVDRYLLTTKAITSTENTQRVQSQKPGYPLRPKASLKPCFPLYVEIEDAEWAKEFLIKNRLYNVRPLVAINPSARWIKKRWPVRSFASLINQLIQELKTGIIILGGREDIAVAEELSSLVGETPAIATGETSLKTLTALIERVDLLVTNDSGPMHIAAALGVPVIALFGPTDPRLTGPYGDGHRVIKKDMDCSPCLRRPCRHGRPLCMEAITVEDVLSEVKNRLYASLTPP